MKQTRRTSPNKAARRAHALELLSSGHEVAAVAKALGVARITVSRWQAEMRAEIEEAAKARTAGVVEGAVEAKALLASKTVEAARKVVRIMNRPGTTETESKINRVALAAAVVVLDRGGVPAKSELDIEGTVLESVHSVLERARKGVK